MTPEEQVRREAMEFRQRLDGWEWVGTEVFEENPTCYRIESCSGHDEKRQRVWIYWTGDGVTAQGKPPGWEAGSSDGLRC